LATLIEEKILETNDNQHLQITGYSLELFTAIPLCAETIILSETELVPKNAYITSFSLLFHLFISACTSYKK